jgi:hypothetical protein
LTKPSTPVVSSPETSGAAIKRAAGLVRPYHERLPAVFTLGEHWVSAAELDDGHRIRVRNVYSRRPLGNQHRGPDVVVMVP